MTITVSHKGTVTFDKPHVPYALSAATADQSASILKYLEQTGKLPPNLPLHLKQKMEESLARYFGQISGDKIEQFSDKAASIIQEELRTTEEAREGGTTAEVGLNPATGRSALTEFLSESVGEDIGAKMGVDFFLRIAREVVQGGVQFVAQNYDQTRVDEFPALELKRVYDRDVPRGSEKDPAGPENGWDDDDGRWQAACEASGDEDAQQVFDDTGRMVALKSSDIWQQLGDGAGGYTDTLGNPFAPFAFQSGMDTDEVSLKEATELGLLDEGEAAEPADVDFDTLFDLPKDLEARFAASVAHRALHAEDAGHEFHGNQWTHERSIPDDDVKAAIKSYTAKGGIMEGKMPATAGQRAKLDGWLKSGTTGEDKPLYQGTAFSDNEWESKFEQQTTTGSVIRLGSPSFSEDEHRVFGYKGGDVAVRYKLVGGMTGRDIQKYSVYPEEQEHLAASDNRYQVVAAEYQPNGGIWTVTVKQHQHTPVQSASSIAATTTIDSILAHSRSIQPQMDAARYGAATVALKAGDEAEANALLKGHGSYMGSCGHRIQGCRCGTVHTPISVDAPCSACAK